MTALALALQANAARWDATVGRARQAAADFRAIEDQAQIDRIVRAMVVAALEAAVDLAELTRGAFEDPSGQTNPRMPMLAELTGLLEAAYG
jgi:alcohol dehydrogenase class IV